MKAITRFRVPVIKYESLSKLKKIRAIANLKPYWDYDSIKQVEFISERVKRWTNTKQ